MQHCKAFYNHLCFHFVISHSTDPQIFTLFMLLYSSLFFIFFFFCINVSLFLCPFSYFLPFSVHLILSSSVSLPSFFLNHSAPSLYLFGAYFLLVSFILLLPPHLSRLFSPRLCLALFFPSLPSVVPAGFLPVSPLQFLCPRGSLQPLIQDDGE